ncbi:hypothetical protein A0U40_05205 [[Bacillus] sp. KCTC 13219]|nr:hypothetical protein A0U40_05205 [[Bacillus] sp. KCTC 13219]
MVNYYWDRYQATPNYSYSTEEYNPSTKGGDYSISSAGTDANILAKFIDHLQLLFYSTSGAQFARPTEVNFYTNAVASAGGVSLGGTRYPGTKILKDFENATTPFKLYSMAMYRAYGASSYVEQIVVFNLTKTSSSIMRVTSVSFVRSKSTLTSYTQGALVQANVQADYNAYTPNARNADGYWYVRKGIVNTAPNKVQIPAQTVRKNTTASIALSNYFSDAEGNTLTYTTSSSNTNIATVTLTGSTLTITGKAIGVATITVTASDGSLSTSQTFNVTVANTIPTVAVTQPTANVTLYENDLLQVTGSASDIDANQSITIYAQVNNEQRIVLNVGLSNAPVTFNKQLKFKGGVLYDGETLITGNLTDGTPHTLKIWAQDGDGAQSTITERAFYVVPNRPPVLTIDSVQPSGIIDNDKFIISGEASDPDNNTVTAAYRINGGNSVALEITEGHWAFDIALAQLVIGQNTIVIELVDSYNFKVSKTIKLNKNEVKTPILQSVARYKIEPPKGSAKGVLLWIQRDEGLDLIAELSMTLQGEQEQYVTLTADHTAPVASGVVEDEFYHEADEPKNNIILKLSTSRPSVDVNHKIHLISGVLE